MLKLYMGPQLNSYLLLIFHRWREFRLGLSPYGSKREAGGRTTEDYE